MYLFMLRYFTFCIGWGVFAMEHIEKGAFLLEYRGCHHVLKDMKEKIKTYKKQGLYCFIYEYEMDGVKYWKLLYFNFLFLRYLYSIVVHLVRNKMSIIWLQHAKVSECCISTVILWFRKMQDNVFNNNFCH